MVGFKHCDHGTGFVVRTFQTVRVIFDGSKIIFVLDNQRFLGTGMVSDAFGMYGRKRVLVHGKGDSD